MADELHVCDKGERIAKLESTVQSQSDADNRIERELKELASQVRDNHDASNSELKELNKSFGKLEGLINAQSEKIDTLNTNVNASNTKLDKLTSRVSKLEKTVEGHTTEIETLKEDKGDHDRRLTSVEKNVIKISAIIGAILFLIQLIGGMTSCQDIKSTVHQILQEEKQAAQPMTSVVIEQQN